MSLVLDHINLRTQDLGRMVEWYGRVLGLTPQARPAFVFDGAWLGDGVGAPSVHVVAVDDLPVAYAADQQLEHYAFAATGLADFLAHLRAEKVAYYCRVLPTTETRQINFHDCDGNHLHVDFPASETADLSTYDGT